MNRTTLILKYKEVENWEEYIVVLVCQEEDIIMEVCVHVCVCVCLCVCVCPSICKQVQYLYVDNHGPVNLSLGSLMLPMLFLSSFCDDIIVKQERCGLHQTTPRPLLL